MATMFSAERVLFPFISAIAIAKCAHELLIFRNLSGANEDPLARSARLMAGALRMATSIRFTALILGGVVLPQLAFAQKLVSPWIAPSIFILLLLAELTERSLFFRAVAQPKMPGGMA